MTPDEELQAKILTAVSPSNIGDYAACPYKLVLDALHARVEKPFLAPYAAFGTVAHWFTQTILINRGIAVATNLKAPDDRTIQLARECKGITGAYEEQFVKWMKMVATKAADILELVSPLPAGTHWVAEKSSYNPGIMPSRLGRKGNVSGFGGSIDVLRSDRAVLWDFKFVGTDKVPTPPSGRGQPKAAAGISNTYLWQMASYHITEGVAETGILWTSRDSETVSYILIDWRKEQAARLAEAVHAFIRFVGYKDFHKLAWPVRGETCNTCDHAGSVGRCPAFCVPHAELPGAAMARAGLAQLMDLSALEPMTGSVSLFQ